MIAFARSRGFSVFHLFDVIGPSSTIGLFFGRVANFINQELYGKPTDFALGVIFPITGDGIPRHPSQLYEGILEGLVLFAILRYLTHSRKMFAQPGFVAGAFVCGYAIARIAVEFVRLPDPQIGYLLGGWLTMGMVLSLPFIAIGFLAQAIDGALGMAFGVITNTMLVGVVQGRSDAANNGNGRFRSKRLQRNPIRQRSPRHVAHHQKQLIVVLAKIINRHNRPVLQRGHRPRLSFKSLTKLRLIFVDKRQHFQRHLTAKARIMRQVDRRHATIRDLRFNFVAVKRCLICHKPASIPLFYRHNVVHP